MIDSLMARSRFLLNVVGARSNHPGSTTDTSETGDFSEVSQVATRRSGSRGTPAVQRQEEASPSAPRCVPMRHKADRKSESTNPQPDYPTCAAPQRMICLDPLSVEA